MGEIDVNKYAIFKNINTKQVVGIETTILSALQKEANYKMDLLKVMTAPCVYLKHDISDKGLNIYSFIDEQPNEVCLGDLSAYTIINYSGDDFLKVFGK